MKIRERLQGMAQRAGGTEMGEGYGWSGDG